jgi:hypothetical protein
LLLQVHRRIHRELELVLLLALPTRIALAFGPGLLAWIGVTATP